MQLSREIESERQGSRGAGDCRILRIELGVYFGFEQQGIRIIGKLELVPGMPC